MFALQDVIHKFEEGAGMRRLRKFLAVLAVLVFVVLCNWRNFRNFSTAEAMDSAQLARNLSEGKGYTTLFVRPFSMYLIESVNQQKLGPPPADTRPDYAQVRNVMHPDVSNPPVYPVVLAGWMKVYQGTLKGMEGVRNVLPEFAKNLLPQFNDSTKNPVWQKDGRFWWHPGDFFIGVFNQILFFVLIGLTFFWAKKLFDLRVALISALFLFGSEFLWHFSFSGLSTILLLLIFMGLVWGLTFLDREVREPKWGASGLMPLAVVLGLLVGIGGLTRYAFAWLIIPVIIYVILFGGPRRAALCLVTFAAFAAIMTPWIVRNYHLTGTAFGTSTYSAFEGTGLFPEFRLQRALQPDLSRLVIRPLWGKLLSNTRGILQNDLPRLGGSWVTALFLAGLLIGFLNITIRRLRYFLLLCLGLLIVVQALGRTQLSEDSPDFNSENLLVLLVPLVTVYGVSLFFVLLDQMNLPLQSLRYLVISLFSAVVCLPLIFTFLPPPPSPYAYPPYNPPLVELFSTWMKEDELTMSDIPWAVAWYGKRQSVWLTGNAQSDFFALNDYKKTVNALYLTPKTMDKRFLSEWVKAGEQSWGIFVITSLLQKEVPPTFPLRKAPAIPGLQPDNLFLTDWERWSKPN